MNTRIFKLTVLALLMVGLVLTACQPAAPAEEEAAPAEEEEAAPAEEEEEEAAPAEEEEAAPAEEEEEEAAPAEEEQILITAVAAEVGIPYFTTMQCGAMAAAEKYNVDLSWSGPAEWDFNKQQPFIDGALALDPDAMIIVPTDPDALVAFVTDWMDEGLPVVTVDVTLSEPVELQGIESDQYSGGVVAADAMFEATGGEGTYLPVGTTPGSYGANQRVAGFVDRMKELKPDVDILDTCYPHHDVTLAAECVSAAILGEPDLRGVFVATSAPAGGASSAIIQAGKQGEVLLTSFDADPQQVQDLKAGVYETVVAQDPYQMGYNAVELLAQYVWGEIDAEDIEQQVVVEMAALTIDNVDDPSLQKYHYVGDINLCPAPPE
jgi:ribose transport system substrate-binding protein